jgi:hypothetical protein
LENSAAMAFLANTAAWMIVHATIVLPRRRCKCIEAMNHVDVLGCVCVFDEQAFDTLGLVDTIDVKDAPTFKS